MNKDYLERVVETYQSDAKKPQTRWTIKSIGGTGSHGQDGGNGWNGQDGSDATPKLLEEQFKEKFPNLCRRLSNQRSNARVNFMANLNKTLPEKDRKLNEFDNTLTVSFNIEGPKDGRRLQIKVNYYDPDPLFGLRRNQLVLLKGVIL